MPPTRHYGRLTLVAGGNLRLMQRKQPTARRRAEQFDELDGLLLLKTEGPKRRSVIHIAVHRNPSLVLAIRALDRPGIRGQPPKHVARRWQLVVAGPENEQQSHRRN